MKKYMIALYIRLSLEDAKTDSMSISSQRNILREYASELPEYANAELMEFVDNGYSCLLYTSALCFHPLQLPRPPQNSGH